MVLTKAIVHDPPAARRLRYVAPVLVVLGLALLTMVPGLLIHMGASSDESRIRDIFDQLVLDLGH